MNTKKTPANRKMAPENRLAAAGLAIGLVGLSLWVRSTGDGDILLGIAGASALFFAALHSYFFVQERRERQLAVRARSVQTCPDCAEEVKAEAHVCRYCGFRFSELEETSSTT